MSLQKQVNLYYSGAVAGDRASHNPVIYLPRNPLAEGVVYVGRFVFKGTDPENQVKTSGSVVAGFVERLLNYYNFTLTSGGTLAIPDETPVTVATIGEFYAAYASTAPTIGQKAFANTTTGVITYAAAGETVDGSVETSFVVKKVREEDGLAFISNWTPAA